MRADYVIGQVSRRRGEVLHVRLKEYKGRMYADVRVYFPSEHDVLEPSRKGVMLTPAELQQVLPLLTRAGALLAGKMLCGDEVPVPAPEPELSGNGHARDRQVIRRPSGELIIRDREAS